jgi:hypothetical protein
MILPMILALWLASLWAVKSFISLVIIHESVALV